MHFKINANFSGSVRFTDFDPLLYGLNFGL
jgi:hypothetical protein